MFRWGVVCALVCMLAAPAAAQEARRRWEMQRQIRLDKFEQVLPQAMRDNGIDMWIVAVKENHTDPLWDDLGRGYVCGIGYYVFTDRGGDRHRAGGARAERLPGRAVGRLRHLRVGVDAGGLRQGARPAAHRRQHVRARSARPTGCRTPCTSTW